jgi:hypothetical protein
MPPLAGWVRSIDLPLCLLLAYLVALWVGSLALEILARAHFRKARHHGHEGFEFDPLLDRYQCPQGELLTLHTFDDLDKLAIYKAPASSCNACALKTFCTPHDEGRRIYRPLAEFHETDVGLFHHRLSLAILAIATLFALGGVIVWWGRSGEPAFLVATGASLLLLRRSFGEASSRDGRKPGETDTGA